MQVELKKFSSSYQTMKGSFLKSANTAIWFLGRHAFLGILVLLLVSILLGGILLFSYTSSLNKESETINAPIKFQDDVYNAVLAERKLREDFLKNPPEKTYTDPFQ